MSQRICGVVCQIVARCLLGCPLLGRGYESHVSRRHAAVSVLAVARMPSIAHLAAHLFRFGLSRLYLLCNVSLLLCQLCGCLWISPPLAYHAGVIHRLRAVLHRVDGPVPNERLPRGVDGRPIVAGGAGIAHDICLVHHGGAVTSAEHKRLNPPASLTRPLAILYEQAASTVDPVWPAQPGPSYQLHFFIICNCKA